VRDHPPIIEPVNHGPMYGSNAMNRARLIARRNSRCSDALVPARLRDIILLLAVMNLRSKSTSL
jgi:hypothetical protein